MKIAILTTFSASGEKQFHNSFLKILDRKDTTET